mmetsp:Transcript_38770/g.82740  ORF Transcript_38770/g.82740 Transcript_38770/m.82740 type:complete len:515 (+) Transcript_38770:153-1697(+)|eukprot:CAMPEP_0172554882 /NCGR_PEP_ID=MMETSP1067-20121228/56853_1 /TAXON_ID=265564 ORGANISM="Thalassiosira punctigera, Strain Tpunct2005C2" /NCGR_SAMPLE_ID=MMETSP1067 /ASSEMBLY_ACC=CAM_ASM_000444 /LENGTH=514 /DNA_ID=CAMNT_0013343341 /DNA_START=74 /DNA_END=1618 /DNA_ORIENTATION=-
MRRLRCCFSSAAVVIGQFFSSTAGFTTRRIITIHPAISDLRLSSSLLSSYNPNDGESPEERQARMENVRKIQASFYNEAASTQSDTENNDDEARWLTRDRDASVMHNVPLWRVQWTELPGYQNVLNVHVAHYTHMFRKLVLQHPKPWYFGHVFLPEGSENLANPDYFLPERDYDKKKYEYPPRDEEERLRKVSTVATLMQITDYMEQEDGRLTLMVQGIGRMKILAASQQVPYAIASKVRILPDVESFEPIMFGLTGLAPTSYDLSMAYMDAARAAAARESELLRDLEFHNTEMEQKKTSDGDVMIMGVSPLSNVNGSVTVDFDEVEFQMKEALLANLAKRAEESGDDEILLASKTLPSPDILVSTDEDTIELERDLWIKVDEMLQLLGKAQPGVRIPVPSQILGLLPVDADWPDGFRLQEYAEQLEENEAKIGTYSKSPFIRLSKVYPEYPTIRRASRFSYTVWLLIDGLGAIGGELFSKEQYLNMDLCRDRLRNTIDYVELINVAIKGIIGS